MNRKNWQVPRLFSGRKSENQLRIRSLENIRRNEFAVENSRPYNIASDKISSANLMAFYSIEIIANDIKAIQVHSMHSKCSALSKIPNYYNYRFG